MALSLNAFHWRQLTLTLDAMTAYPCLKTGSVVSYYQHHHRTSFTNNWMGASSFLRGAF